MVRTMTGTVKTLEELYRVEHAKLGEMLLDKSVDGRAAANWQGGKCNGIANAISALTASASEPTISDAQISTVWQGAMTVALNLIIKRQNDLNDDDGPMAVLNEQGEIIARLRQFLTPDASYIEELRTILPASPVRASEPRDAEATAKAVEWLKAMTTEDWLLLDKYMPDDLRDRLRAALAVSPVSASEPEPVAWPELDAVQEQARHVALGLTGKADTSRAISVLLEMVSALRPPANPVPTPDGAVEALEELARDIKKVARELEQGNSKRYASQVLHGVYENARRAIDAAALETPWQKPGRAAQAQAGEKPDFPADEQSGETSHGVDYWLHYDHQTGKWCVDRQPPKVIRMGAEVIHVREVAALSHPADGWRATHRHVKRGTEYALIGIGKMQAEKWQQQATVHDPDNGNPTAYNFSVDMREVAIYRSVDDGSLWARPREEFEDGRFEQLAAKPEGE